MNHRDERLGSAPLGKLMFSLAVPSVAAQLINVLYNIVDRIYIGHIPGYGDVALTGVGVTFPILTMISAFRLRQSSLEKRINRERSRSLAIRQDC